MWLVGKRPQFEPHPGEARWLYPVSIWHAEGVIPADTAWLTVPDLVDLLGLPQSRIRRLFEDRVLLATRVDGVLKVPASFLDGDEPLGALHGTLVLLADNGFGDDEAIEWMLADEESLGTSPIAALHAGRKAEVRRVAQALL